jgi:hypothetical protein
MGCVVERSEIFVRKDNYQAIKKCSSLFKAVAHYLITDYSRMKYDGYWLSNIPRR